MATASRPVSFEIRKSAHTQETGFVPAVGRRKVNVLDRRAALSHRVLCQAVTVVLFLILMALCGRTAFAQESVLYSFPSSCYPSPDAAPILDNNGNLYGTCVGAQPAGGTIYELSPNGSGGWTGQTIFTFANNGDNSTGSQPNGLVFDAAKVNIYGTTNFGGAYNLGTVFELSPGSGGWTETVLYSFGAGGELDASLPLSGVILDASGNLYGTTSAGGADFATGTVYELSPGTPWKETLLHSFADVDTGGDAITSRLVFDGQGNLYGSSPTGGGASFGAVFKLSPAGGGAWTETVLYGFGTNGSIDAETPVGALVFDGNGNLYGAASGGGANSVGAVFELSPGTNNIWTEKVLYSFQSNPNDGYTPVGGVSVDSKGNVYGTNSVGGLHAGEFGSSGYGNIYQLTPGTPYYTENVLYNFNWAASDSDSFEPRTTMAWDSLGNLYGAALGGTDAAGSVFEFTAAAVSTHTPQFSPAPGSYTTTQTVTISDLTPDATIYYTTDGSTPSTSSITYSSPLTVSSIETIKAIATSSGLLESAVGVGKFIVAPAAATPVISASTGVYTAPLSVTITDASAGTSIYYTLDGSIPSTSSTLYTGAITVLSSEFVNAIASGGDFSSSAEASSFVIISNPIAAAPIASPPAGSYSSAQSVMLSDSTPGATIYYTTNGTTPSTSSSVYGGAITVSATETIKAIAVASSYANSAVTTAAYTIGTSAAATPVFTPAAGTYTSAQSVTISDTTNGATIYYTTNGNTPTTSSTKYTGAIAVSTTETVKAIATASGFNTSSVAIAAYTIDIPSAAVPIISPSGGPYTSAQSVTITDATAGATIYYTTNGTPPSTSSSIYSGAITVSSTETIEAIAAAPGYLNSSAASATYTITLPFGAQVSVLYNFNNETGCPGSPAMPVFDNTGNLYSTCNGLGGDGEIFELTPTTIAPWTETTISFDFFPSNGLLFDATKTNLYGVDDNGANGLGSVYEISPATGGKWTTTTLYSFQHGTDGQVPSGALIWDTNGNLYGTTSNGGTNGTGTVFELYKVAGVWTEKILYSFGATAGDASNPAYGLVFDSAGNLYGASYGGGNANSYGAVFELSPQQNGTWTEKVIHTFDLPGNPDGFHPAGNLIIDAKGNLYGAIGNTVSSGSGAVFELSPAAGGTFTETILHTFFVNGTDGGGPHGSLTMDSSGNLYGVTTQGGPRSGGTIYKLVPSSGVWNESILFGFEQSGDNIGSYPASGLTPDASGNFYGATSLGGPAGGGSVYKFTPGPITATPTFSLAAGNYATTQTVELADAVPSALIYYTTNGSEPGAGSTLYTGAITVSANETINAIAIAPGYASSFVASAAYTIGEVAAATPVFTPAAGAYTSTQSVTISDATAGAVIYYTTNQTTPSTSSTKYTGAITVSGSETIEAIAVATGYINSAIASASYTIGPIVQLSATNLTFPGEKVGATSPSQTVTLTNNGTTALTITSISVTGANASSFLFSNTCGSSLAAGANCSIHGHFTPSAVGPLTAAITISYNLSGSPQTVALSGAGLGQMSLSATSLSFPSEPVGTTSPSQSVTMTNTGTAAFPISGITVTGANASSFAFANTCGTSLAAGANCTIHGHFTPAATGALTAAISINDYASGPQSITLTGTGGTPPAVMLSATSLNFPTEPVGVTSASQSVTMTNTGGAPLSITSIAVTGAGASSFGFANTCGTSLAAGANCTIHGHFDPVAAGALTATIAITDNASGSPQSISLSGTGGAPPAVSLSATSLTFASQAVGTTSASQSVTLTNTGGLPLSISSIAVTGANASSFVFANTCATSLAAGANCTIHGHFTPAAKGALNAAITITDNASGSPQSISLSGTGH